MSNEQDEETKKRLADTNMENYGSKEHRDLRRNAAKGERAWDGTDCKEVGVRVWRIEKFNVVDWAKGKKGGKGSEQFGSFFAGDSFIILDTYEKKDENAEEDEEAQIAYNIHFWLGKETTQDEMGTAAYKTVELDDFLGDLPVQYREVQGHESKLFKELFPSMEIMEGGIESGFRHVKPKEYKPRLLHVHMDESKKRKKRKTEIQQVSLSNDEVNSTDCFILDAGLDLYAFNGPSANPWEKRATNDYINNLDVKRNGRCKKNFVSWEDDNAVSQAFWELLGGKPDTLPESAGFKKRHDEEEASYANHVNALYHITDENGEVEIEKKQSGVLDRAILKEEDDDVIVVDVGRVVYVWLGKDCNRTEQVEAMSYATKVLNDTGRPIHTPVVRITDGNEPAAFWKCFGKEHVGSDVY